MPKPEPNTRSLESDGIIEHRQRERIMSGSRVAVALMAMATLIVAGLTGLIFVLVSSVFESMTPSVRRDLEWKARRGAIELSQTTQLGLVVGDPDVVREAAGDYLTDSDVVGVVALGADDTPLLEHGMKAATLGPIWASTPNQVHFLDGLLVTWSPSTIEGRMVGKMAVAVSTNRLRAGDELRARISGVAAAGGVVAILLVLGFLALYIWPILRLTQDAFIRLEGTTKLALEAARLKAQFLANMSHEIRTPMNSVVGLAKLLLDIPLSSKARAYAERIDASAASLLNIINDILDFSKLEAGKYRIHRAPCEPVILLQEIAELLAERAQSKGIELVLRMDPEVPSVVEADLDRLRQILTNLVGNAVKFTDRGEVLVQLSKVDRQEDEVDLRFEVHDSGIGIAAEVRDHIFESFSQADGSTVRQFGGTGLGLAISKQLVALMGGSIGVESEVGKGSTFWFTLPAKVVDARSALTTQAASLNKRALLVCDNQHAATSLFEHVKAWGMSATLAASEEAALQVLAEPNFDVIVISETTSGTQGAPLIASIKRKLDTPPPVVVLTQLRTDDARHGLDHVVAAQLPQPVRMSALYECLGRVLSSSHIRPEAPVKRVRGRIFQGTRVLVVDDNEMNQFVAAELLASFGCTVDQARDGQEAVERVLASHYAIVLMDCQMPVMDGYTACKEIRAREPEGRRSVIVALTAHALEGERERVLAAGMDDYMTKPVRPQMLERVLARWIHGEAVTHAIADGEPPAVSEEDDPASAALSSCATDLLRMFVDRVPIQLELLDGALAAGDAGDVRSHAHKLKGSLLAVTAQELAGLAERLHADAEDGNLGESGATFQQLLDGFYELEARVKCELRARNNVGRGVAHG